MSNDTFNVTISHFDSLTTTTGVPQRHRWDALAMQLSAFWEYERKEDGALWSPTLYKGAEIGGTCERKAANVEALTCLVLDFDHGPAPKVMMDRMKQYEFLIHTTYSHTAAAPRYRMVLPLARPVLAAMWPALFAVASEALAAGHTDGACKDLCRFYYYPSAPPGGKGFARRNAGALLNPDDFTVQMTEWEKARQEAAQPRMDLDGAQIADLQGGTRRPATALVSKYAEQAFNGNRSRKGLDLACQLRDEGHSVAEAEAALKLYWKMVPQGAEPYTVEQALGAVRQAYSREAREPARPLSPPKKKSGFARKELREMELEETNWAIPGYVPEGLTILAGDPKSGKSWFALQAACAVASGGMAWGKILCEQGRVLYLALEDGPRRLKDRLELLDPDGAADDLLHLYWEWPTLHEGGLEEIRKWCEEYPDTRYVVIDTWGRFMQGGRPGGNPNVFQQEYGDWGRISRLAINQRISIKVVHHFNKSQTNDPFQRISGTQATAAAADSLLCLVKPRESQVAEVHRSGKDVELSALAFAWDARLCTWTLMGDAEEISATAAEQALVDAAIANGGGITVAEGIREIDRSRGTVRTLLGRLEKKGKMMKTGLGSYKLVGFTPKEDPRMAGV